MANKLTKPQRKNPQRRTRQPTPPPLARSRAALGFSARAAAGQFMLQACDQCQAVTYPPRDVCPKCWSKELVWTAMDPIGELLTDTVLHTSTNVYFRERMPWRIGTVKLKNGVPLLAHVHSDAVAGQPVRLIARTDKAGQGVILALPIKETPHMNDDKQFRELSATPRFRRVLVSDARTELGQAVVRSLVDAGASKVFAGIAEPWKPFPGRDALQAIENVELVALDVTQGDSVMELAGSIGGKTDILINTASHARPGTAMTRRGVMVAKDEMETNYFGLLRLLQNFGPAMRGRAADGDNNAVCWVNLLSVYALSNWPAYGTSSASQAAAFSLAQSARADFLGSGIKLANVFHGPLDDEWHQPVSPPKVAPRKLASETIRALEQGLEEVFVGDVAQDLIARWRDDPGVLERELMMETSAE